MTGMSPFFANKGYNPWLTILLTDVPWHKAHLAVTDLKTLHNYLKEQILAANASASHFADTHHVDTQDWPEGTLVWLNGHNIQMKQPMKKLDHK